LYTIIQSTSVMARDKLTSIIIHVTCLHNTYWIRTLNPNYPRYLCNHSTQVHGSSIILKNLNPNHLWTILCVIVICEYKDVWYSGLSSDFRPFPLNFRPYWFVSVHPHIPVSFPNPHFPNPIPFPPKNIETEVEMGFFRPFPSVFIATGKHTTSQYPMYFRFPYRME
jgi:hypothetical protein